MITEKKRKTNLARERSPAARKVVATFDRGVRRAHAPFAPFSIQPRVACIRPASSCCRRCLWTQSAAAIAEQAQTKRTPNLRDAEQTRAISPTVMANDAKNNEAASVRAHPCSSASTFLSRRCTACVDRKQQRRLRRL
eukprot:6188854-Pleurochrysis_carterae.AAC.2